MPKWSRRAARCALASSVALMLLVAGCRPDATLRSPDLPTPGAAGLASCKVAPSQLRPLIVEWPGADRGSLEHQIRDGVVAVRYEGCALEVLTRCRVDRQYAYAGFSRKRDTVVIESIDDLYSHMPRGAARLEPRLVQGAELRADMTFVGMYTAGRADFTRTELVGECAGATHVLSAAQVGAFSFYSGAAAAYGESSAAQEMISSDGDPAACDAATTADVAPPEGCSGIVRVELTPLPVITEPVMVPDRPARSARRDDRPRPRKEKLPRSRRGPGVDPATVFIGIAVSLWVAGLASGGVWFASKGRLNNIEWAMKEVAPGTATWQGLNERHTDLEPRVKASGWTAVACFAVGSPMLVGSILGASGVGIARVGVTPIVNRSYGGVALSFRF